MIRNLAVLNIAEMFERFTYYGVRSILLLFLIKGLLWSNTDAIEFYGTFTMIIYFTSIMGGVLTDVTRKPALIAVIGNSLTTIGVFLLAMADSPWLLYIAAGSLTLGAGLFKPSIIAALFRVSFTHKHRLDLIFTIFYCAINLGALVAPWVIGSFGDTGNPANFRLGFAVAGCFSLIPTVLLANSYKNLISNDLLYDNQTFRSSDIGVTNIMLCFLLGVIFWLAYALFPVFMDASGDYSSTIAVTIAGFIFYLVMIPLHLIRNFRSALKISIGILMVAFVCIIYPMLKLPPVSGLLLLAVAEVLIIPVMWSQLIQNVSPRFTGIIMSALMFLTLCVNKAAAALNAASTDEQPPILYILAGLCVGLMCGFLLLDHFQKKRELDLPQQLN